MRNVLVLASAGTLFATKAAEVKSPGAVDTPKDTKPLLEPAKPQLWEAGVGEGFSPGVQSFNVGLGAAYGLAAFGGHESHDLALLNFEYGHMLGHTLGDGHWFRGNLEWRLQLFTGAEFSPSQEWLVGLTPHLRYDFATGTAGFPFSIWGRE